MTNTNDAGSVTPHLAGQGTAGFIGRAGHPSTEGISTARPQSEFPA
jgi:hypothetical protein